MFRFDFPTVSCAIILQCWLHKSEAPRLVGGSRDSPSLKFEELLERLTGDDPKRVSARFENWLKRRSFKNRAAPLTFGERRVEHFVAPARARRGQRARQPALARRLDEE